MGCKLKSDVTVSRPLLALILQAKLKKKKNLKGLEELIPPKLSCSSNATEKC